MTLILMTRQQKENTFKEVIHGLCNCLGANNDVKKQSDFRKINMDLKEGKPQLKTFNVLQEIMEQDAGSGLLQLAS